MWSPLSSGFEPVSSAAAPGLSVKALRLEDTPTELGSECMARVENLLDLHDVLLDSGADVNVTSREETQKPVLIPSRPVMEHLGYWADAILARVCDTQREWDLQKLSGEEENASINLIRDNSLLRSVARCI
ncbi:hypothetical protein GQ600_9073 [Phytophthora cactorum]|nr:hypothetical protein GQ600_9073 [Phytophthora cactorum]